MATVRARQMIQVALGRVQFLRQAAVLILVFSGAAIAAAQSDPAAIRLPGTAPEIGYVSPEKYTNAFFGFSLPLPQDSALREFRISFKDDGHFLFGLQSQKVSTGFFGPSAKLAIFTVTAKQSGNTSPEEVRKAASGPKRKGTTKIEIGGREFWKSESQEKGAGGRLRSVAYATSFNGYVLQFNIESFDDKLTDKLQHSIESITFFDPAKAAEMAGSGSVAYDPPVPRDGSEAAVPSSKRIGSLSPGLVKGNTYVNDALGIHYEFPDGWVVNDEATQNRVMEAGHQFAWGNSPGAAREHEAFQQCARVLLFTTKYPAGTKGDEMNPLIVIMAMDPECSPGARFPTSIDERDAIKQIAQQMIHSFAGTPFIPKGKTSVRAFMVQAHLMLEFSGDFTVNVPGQAAPKSIFTSFAVTEARDYWIAWGFMSDSQAGLQELKNTKIEFASPGQHS
jgi:hypothetical protein